MRKLLSLLIVTMIIQQLPAQEIPLYEKTIPNSKTPPADYPKELDSSDRIKYVTHPTIIPYFPEKGKATGTSVLIFPGGGYFLLSMPACVEIAKGLTQAGITAFIVKYRLPSDATMQNKSIGPLQDAQAAILLVRKRAAEWGLDPKKVGMMGLSAGGHLVSMEATQLNRVVIENKENIDLRPSFIALLYPVIIYDPEVPRTRENLIGKNPSPQTLDYYSTNKHVTSNTPPAFLVHAADDETIPVKNTLEFFTALLQAKVKAEMHILQSGDHGFALTDLNSGENWFNHFRSWLKENGF